MKFTLIGLAIIIFFGISGYTRGVLRIMACVFALFLAALLASPFSFFFSGIVQGWEAVPLALKPWATFLLTAFVIFFFTGAAGEVLIYLREKKRRKEGLPLRTKGEQYGGAVLGSLWGLFIVILICTSINIIGNIDMTVSKSMKQIEHLRAVKEAYAENISNLPDNSYDPLAQNTPKIEIPPAPTVSPEETSFSSIKEEVDTSIFYPVVNYVNPVDDKSLEVFENLFIVTSDPELFIKFQSHPEIARFTGNEKILKVSEDEEVQYCIQNQQYRELLNNQKIADLLNDRDLYEELRDINMNQILIDVINEGSKR